MNSIGKFINKVNIPPTRCMRYKDLPSLLVQKNSYKNPVKNLYKIRYQTFNINWNKNMASYEIKETTNYNSYKNFF